MRLVEKGGQLAVVEKGGQLAVVEKGGQLAVVEKGGQLAVVGKAGQLAVGQGKKKNPLSPVPAHVPGKSGGPLCMVFLTWSSNPHTKKFPANRKWAH